MLVDFIVHNIMEEHEMPVFTFCIGAARVDF